MRAVVLQQQQKKKKKKEKTEEWGTEEFHIKQFTQNKIHCFTSYSRVSVLSNKLLGHTRKKQGEMILTKKKHQN